MADETDVVDALDAEIEKAKGRGLIRGGSSKTAKRMQNGGFRRTYGRVLTRMSGFGGAADRMLDRELRRKDAGHYAERRMSRNVYKSADDLYDAIEKARGLIPRGGSHKLNTKIARRRVGGKYSEDKKYQSVGVSRYLEGRNGNESFRSKPNPKAPFGSRARTGRHLRREIYKAKAKTLYVYRPVENAADIIAWAESQGFKSTQPADKLHVTLCFSKTPLNWANLHDDYHLEPSDYASESCCGPVLRSAGGDKTRRIQGGVREVKALGSDGAVVLAFESDSLTRRFMDFKSAGAVWSFPSFNAHITITYDGGSVDLSKVHPYAGDIVLGEECWEEVDPNGQAAAIAAESKGVKKALDALDQRLAAVEKATAKEAETA